MSISWYLHRKVFLLYSSILVTKVQESMDDLWTFHEPKKLCKYFIATRKSGLYFDTQLTQIVCLFVCLSELACQKVKGFPAKSFVMTWQFIQDFQPIFFYLRFPAKLFVVRFQKFCTPNFLAKNFTPIFFRKKFYPLFFRQVFFGGKGEWHYLCTR